MIYLLVGTALAQNIQPVAPGETVTAETQSYLLPEDKYDKCLTTAANLPVCQKALDSCTETGVVTLEGVQAALDASLRQFRHDEELIQEQLLTIEDLESQLTTTTAQGQKWKNQRNLALVAAGTLVLGATAATAISVAF